MDCNGQIEARRQTALLDEGLALLGHEILTPIVVESDLANGTESDPLGGIVKVALNQSQLLTPAGIVVHRRRVESHHRVAHLRLGLSQ